MRKHDTGRSEIALTNGDVYIGNVDESLPQGVGKYIWSDGTYYEGEWKKGKLMGRGQICWESGAKYDGDVSGGFLHGYGTFYGVDGSTYRGSWRMDTPHGSGTKVYANSDVYDGIWKEGLQEGIGKYTWSNGNVYVGSWKAGEMTGRGVMKWANGDVFDGVWLEGLEHGPGCYKFGDGAFYFGTWSNGLKDGPGIFCPPGKKRTFQQECYESIHRRNGVDRLCAAEFTRSNISRTSTRRLLHFWNIIFLGHSMRISNKTTSIHGLLDHQGSGHIPIRDNSLSLSCSSDVRPRDEDENSYVIEREYMQGVLIMERLRNHEAGKLHKKQRFQPLLKKHAKVPGEIIYKGHKSYSLMLNLQLGIRYTVGKITPVPMREVRSSDFGPRARIKMYFPSKGTQYTPPHYSIDFFWKDYCPMVFRNLREMFKIDAADYMMSMCGGESLKEITSGGKSGSIFYLSQDERFVIKTLRKHELKVLLKMLPKYYNHVGAHDNTLITKFFGLHRITLKSRRKVRFVVMGNMFRTELRIHRRYDLKGSTQGRSTDKENISENTTLKDLDLSYVFYLEKSWRESLFRQISLDCMFLESQCIIDYSMLLGLHFRAPEHLKPPLVPERTLDTSPTPLNDSDMPSQGDTTNPPSGLLLVAHEPGASTLPGSHIRGSTLRASTAGDEEVDLLLPGTRRLRVQLGVNMPAKANRKLLHDKGPDSTEIDINEVYDVVLYLGIIDILQEYNIRKKTENCYKSLKFDPLSISCVEPELYSKRFIGFLEKVFPEEISS